MNFVTRLFGAPSVWRRNSGLSVEIACGVLACLLFLLLAEDVIERESLRFDAPLLLWLHAHSNRVFDRAMLWLSAVGGAWSLLPAFSIAAGLWLKRQRRAAAFLAATLVGVALLNMGAKLVFGRPRPALWLSLAPEYDFGFPSGHAMLSFALAGALVILVWQSDLARSWKRAATVLAVFWIGGVGLSRLYLGVHYPSDILAGWSLSLLWLLLVKRTLISPLTRSQL